MINLFLGALIVNFSLLSVGKCMKKEGDRPKKGTVSNLLKMFDKGSPIKKKDNQKRKTKKKRLSLTHIFHRLKERKFEDNKRNSIDERKKKELRLLQHEIEKEQNTKDLMRKINKGDRTRDSLLNSFDSKFKDEKSGLLTYGGNQETSISSLWILREFGNNMFSAIWSKHKKNILSNPSNLLKYNADGNTLLHLAVHFGYVEISKQIVYAMKSYGIDINGGSSPIYEHIAKNKLDKISLKTLSLNGLSNNAGYTPLGICEQKLLNPKNNTNVNDYKEIRKLLIKEGVQKDPPVIFCILSNAKKPLDLYCNLSLLFTYKPRKKQEPLRLNVRDSIGNTPLHLVVALKHINATKLILFQDVDVNSKNIYGNTPLHIAAEKGLVDIVKLLLSIKNIKPNALNKQKKRAYDLAKNEEIRKLLK